MECSINSNEVAIEGNIRNVNENGIVKEALRSIPDNHILISTRGTTVITSDIIGCILKLINVDGKKISLKTDSEHMVDLLQRLNLGGLLNVQKV